MQPTGNWYCPSCFGAAAGVEWAQAEYARPVPAPALTPVPITVAAPAPGCKSLDAAVEVPYSSPFTGSSGDERGSANTGCPRNSSCNGTSSFNQQQQQQQQQQQCYCICGGGGGWQHPAKSCSVSLWLQSGDPRAAMVACDNPRCSVEWYHFGCVGLDSEVHSFFSFNALHCIALLNIFP
jgi:hypothetical protein